MHLHPSTSSLQRKNSRGFSVNSPSVPEAMMLLRIHFFGYSVPRCVSAFLVVSKLVFSFDDSCA
jgi:hypothetical protein